MNALPILESFNIDISRPTTAISQVRQMVEGSDNPLGAAKALFTSLVTPNHPFTFTDPIEARMTVASLVIDAIRFGEQYDATDSLKRAAEWIMRQRQENPWFFTKEEVVETIERGGVQVEVKEDGKLKKGSKQVLAKALFEQNPTLNNAQLLDLFVKELDMSVAGARTYVYNCRKAVTVGK